MNNLKCPVCDTSDFKEEGGFYVCQICGNKIPTGKKVTQKKEPVVVANKPAKIVSTVIYAFLAVLSLVSFIRMFGYIEYADVSEIIFISIELFATVLMVIGGIVNLRGKVGTGYSMIGFVLYTFISFVTLILNIINGFFVNIVYFLLYVGLAFVATFMIKKWVK